MTVRQWGNDSDCAVEVAWLVWLDVEDHAQSPCTASHLLLSLRSSAASAACHPQTGTKSLVSQ